jgi:hypothetical protein
MSLSHVLQDMKMELLMDILGHSKDAAEKLADSADFDKL